MAFTERFGHGFGDFGLGGDDLGLHFHDLGLHFLFAGDGHGAPFFGARLGDLFVGVGLLGLELGAYVFAYVDVGDVDGENFEGGAGVETAGQNIIGPAIFIALVLFSIIQKMREQRAETKSRLPKIPTMDDLPKKTQEVVFGRPQAREVPPQQRQAVPAPVQREIPEDDEEEFIQVGPFKIQRTDRESAASEPPRRRVPPPPRRAFQQRPETQQRTRRPVPEQQAQQRKAPPQQKDPRAQKQSQQKRMTEQLRRRQLAMEAAAKKKGSKRKAFLNDLDDVRRGIVFAEILGPPKALQQGGDSQQ